MPKYNVIYQSTEQILGVIPRVKEWIEYEAVLTVKDGGKNPVTLAMTFILPQPLAFDMPEKRLIKAPTITQVYAKLVKFFSRYGLELR